jgi:molybdopterin/thiamine biosynthesis adenylyltransferase
MSLEMWWTQGTSLLRGLTRFSSDVQLVGVEKEGPMKTNGLAEREAERSDDGLEGRIEALASRLGSTRLIGHQHAQALADSYGPFQSTAERSSSMRRVELTALEMGVVPARYLASLGTIGAVGQIQLLKATVAVVGLGGLGGYVTEALVRMGIGQLILIDGDKFEPSNLNRQLLCTEASLGVEKAVAACQRVAVVNVAVGVTGRAEALTRENAAQLLRGADVVVDALDRLPTRLALQESAQALGIPMVHGSIAGFLGQVTTIFPGDLGLRALYGDGDDLPEQGLEVELGTPAATPMAVAAWEAQEVMKVLTGRGEPLRDRLLVIDMESATAQVLQLG